MAKHRYNGPESLITEKKQYKCNCGKESFVEVSDNKKNRFPCKECYLLMREQ